jgi:hypothetical protein
MGYNLSDNAFKQVKSILDELIDLEIGGIWKQSFQDNYKAARMIRQGFEYCIANKDNVGERYANLKHNIRIRATNNYVLAERKFTALAPLQGVAERHKKFDGMSDFNGVMTTFLANRHLSSLHFPDFENDNDIDIEKIAEAYGFNVTYQKIRGNSYGLWIIKHGERGQEEEHTN